MGTWEGFLSTTKENRADYYKNGHDKMGKELKGFIEETISEAIAEKEIDKWVKDGKYMDKDDITKKYEGKPEQLKSILEKTETYYCEVRSAWLYEDPEFSSKRTSSTETSKESKRKISTERTLKAGKVAKITPDEGQEEELSAAQIKQFTKEAAGLTLSEKNIQDLLNQCGKEAVAPLIAPPLIARLKMSMASLVGQRQLVEMTLEHKKGDVVTLLKDIKEAKTEAVATARIMRAQLVVANSLLPKPMVKAELESAAAE